MKDRITFERLIGELSAIEKSGAGLSDEFRDEVLEYLKCSFSHLLSIADKLDGNQGVQIARELVKLADELVEDAKEAEEKLESSDG
jgi:hypothetical protein